MGFIKVVKNTAYFKRYQVKYRRRREGKTDYGARRMMVTQEKSKYNTAKYRIIARFTNTKVIAQIAWATIEGDKILTSADSSELPRYGISVGLKNYSAAYCTGLLLARRALQKLGQDKIFVGKTEADGAEYHVEEDFEGNRRPFKAVLDVGLKRTTIGSRVFGVLKGAVDGGIHVPHSTKRFPGGQSGKDGDYDADFHKERIFGGHVAQWMDSLEEDDKQEYEKMFSKYIKAGLNSENLEETYKKVHAAIRKDPSPKAKTESPWKVTRKGDQIIAKDGKKTVRYVRNIAYSLKQRKARVAQRIAHAVTKAAA